MNSEETLNSMTLKENLNSRNHTLGSQRQKKRVHFEDFIKNKDNHVENIKKSPRRKYK